MIQDHLNSFYNSGGLEKSSPNGYILKDLKEPVFAHPEVGVIEGEDEVEDDGDDY